MYDMSNMKKLKKYAELAPVAWQGFLAFDKAAVADGAIPAKTKELIALAVAMTTQCPYCIEIHTKTRRKGAGRKPRSRRRSWSRPRCARAARSRTGRIVWNNPNGAILLSFPVHKSLGVGPLPSPLALRGRGVGVGLLKDIGETAISTQPSFSEFVAPVPSPLYSGERGATTATKMG